LSNIFSQLSAALADRYRLERELGRGGMATVYLAQDIRHKRPVALKVLHPSLAQTLGPERFQREIELAARLQHPHILTVHDSGETAGQLWFIMPYVEGESLRDRLRREKQLPVEDALRIATETARALDYAHRHGVVHRDIKPENILLTNDGDTLVADFGIARALSGADERLTETGLAVGTPAYMSPEQAAGERELDARSDIYSLAAVLYEMLAGTPPFTGPTAQAVMARRFNETPPLLRVLREMVPEGIEQAVLRGLAKAPADRFQTAADFGRALSATGTTPVSPELVEVVPGRTPQTRWQQPFDAAFQDVFQLQADIAGRVAQALDVAIGDPERQALAATGDSAAYDHFLRGNVYFERGTAEPDLRAAEELYQKAVARDPTFALAFAQLSLTHDQLYWFYYDRTEERVAKQKEAAQRAIQLRPDLAEGHLALGFYHYHGRLDYQRALKELESARKLQPSNGKVHFGLGAVHRRQGRWAEAVEDIKKSVELNPRSVTDLTEMAVTFIMLRAYPDAEPYLTRAVEISPDPRAYGTRSFLYLLWRGDTLAAAIQSDTTIGRP